MNVIKHMEAAFIMSLGLACAAIVATEVLPQAQAAHAASASVATPEKLAVVVVPAKRMSAQEKQRSLIEERRVAARSSGSSI